MSLSDPRQRRRCDLRICYVCSLRKLLVEEAGIGAGAPVFIWSDGGNDVRLQCKSVCSFCLHSSGSHCSGSTQPWPMETHPGAPLSTSVRGVRPSDANFGISSHADRKSPAATGASAITIRVGRAGLVSLQAASRLVARIESGSRLSGCMRCCDRRRGLPYQSRAGQSKAQP